MDVAFEIFVKSGSAATIRKAIADIKKALKQLQSDPAWMYDDAALVRSVRPGGWSMDFDELRENKLAGATLHITIGFETAAFEEA